MTFERNLFVTLIFTGALLVGCGDDGNGGGTGSPDAGEDAADDVSDDTADEVGEDADDGGVDASDDVAEDTTLDCVDELPGHLGYSAEFRALLANPAPPELREGERIYYEGTFGTEVLDSWPPAEWMVALWQNDEETWGEQFSNYGWIVDPGDDLPVGLKRGDTDPTKVHETCASCHVDRLPDGRLWSGMPATKLQWSRFRVAINEAWVADGNESLLSDDAIAKLSAIQQPGSSNADSVADPRIVPADFPLYVNLGERDNLGYTGAGRDVRSQVWISMFTFGAGDEVEFPDECTTTPFDAFMAWMVSPRPMEVDEAAVARGRAVFEEVQCNACHNVDDLLADEVVTWRDGPELLPGVDEEFPRGTIATDGAFVSLGDLEGGENNGGPGSGIQKIIRFIFDNGLIVLPTDGYVTADLHGVWATPPYLHNGSVPTLEALLLPASERPVTFEREGFVVDTTREGMSNAGHEFGTDLSEQDKADLISYLESL